jgi:hypothetical protein
MHEAIANITFNSNKIPISKEQIKAILDYFFDKFIDCENITDIKYKDIGHLYIKVPNATCDLKVA